MISTDTYNAEQGWLRADPTRFTLKLGDFGSSRMFKSELPGKTMSRKGTLNFMAPEVKNTIMISKVKARYSSKADVYSAALTMLVLFTKQLHGSVYLCLLIN